MWKHVINIEIQQPGGAPVVLPKEDQAGAKPVEHEHDLRVLLKEIGASMREQPLAIDEARSFKRGELVANVSYVVNKGA